jgi:hypothetical protein
MKFYVIKTDLGYLKENSESHFVDELFKTKHYQLLYVAKLKADKIWQKNRTLKDCVIEEVEVEMQIKHKEIVYETN